jgi:membrane fusion protein, multidrug efflux system
MYGIKWMGAALAGVLGLGGAEAAQATVAPSELATAVVRSASAGQAAGFDGVVEAVRQTVVAAQVSGALVALSVKAGDAVKAGQVLARIDARAAEQSAAAGDAQVLAARAQLDVATKDFARQKRLLEQNYISQAALDRAESQFKATQAQVAAQLAQAGASRTQSGFFVVRAPYAGVVSDVPVSQGDMAMPGKPLLTLYDPGALRVAVAVPQSANAQAGATEAIQVQLPGLAADRQWLAPVRVTLLPTVDAATHTVEMRLDLKPGIAGITPGMFARAWVPMAGEGGARLYAPLQAVVRRAEMTGVYVIDPAGRPVLRQVRLGRSANDSVEILSGVSAGERVATDPQAASRVR